ncbi:YlxR family protein [Chamaesiphon sp. GL140_3_metabinner_50]|uniref:YlxR family protein n=1 Tax=Chamaesiphon sp. GL140_3_metabinner_50 TaxID=2970812 RepID=UPI0025FB3F8E|nr:YlxR family protein [Chamaesiphon sp. GL140_3_metabinner_50]
MNESNSRDSAQVEKIKAAKNERRCVSCRKIAPKHEFWRIVKCHPSKKIAIDLSNILMQGRSAYLCPTDSCLQSAKKKNRLSKSLKATVTDEIYQQLQLLITSRSELTD